MDCQLTQEVSSISFAVEFENAKTICWSDIAQMLQTLTREIERQATNRRFEVIFVHPGPDSDSHALRQGIANEAGRLFHLASVRVLSQPGGRYYELKNLAIAESTGDVIVLIDSDTVLETGWLEAILAPFSKASTIAVSGHTYLLCRDFVSRTIALFWVFPVRGHDAKWTQKRALNANNCAFRRNWLQSNWFPKDDGFKVSCSLLAKNLQAQGHSVVHTDARAGHQPLRGWRFLVWRALVTGRDADRKYCRLKSMSMFKRCVHSLSFWYKMERRTVHRMITLYRQVSMPLWQVPAAITLGVSFYSLGFLGQLLRVFGLGPNRPELVPEYAEYT